MEKGRLACRDARVILQISSPGRIQLNALSPAANAPGAAAREERPRLRLRDRRARDRDAARPARGRRACATSPTMSPGSSRSGARALGAVPPSCSSCRPSSRAKRVSLGALAALTVGPTASIAAGGASAAAATGTEPTTTTENMVVLTEGAEGRQVQLLQKALGDQRRRHLRPGNGSRGQAVPGTQRALGRRHRRAADMERAARLRRHDRLDGERVSRRRRHDARRCQRNRRLLEP